MHSIKRLAQILFGLVRDKKYRARTLNTIAYHLKQVDRDDTVATPSYVTPDCLKSKRFYLIGGCELTYVKDALAYYGAVTHHTFDHGGNVDPLGEAQAADSRVAAFQPDFVVLSQVQRLRGVIQKLQQNGFQYDLGQQRHDLAALADELNEAARLLFAASGAPMFVLTYPLKYRPALGPHEYKSLADNLSLIEILRTYELEVYQAAKQVEQAYVVDTNLILERGGKQHAIRDEDADGIYEHFSKAGSLEIAHNLIAQTQILDPNLQRVKCAVFDLDGTLWDGVLREDGVAGVHVKTNFLSMLTFLTCRGILLAICSKNDPSDEHHVRDLLGTELFDRFSAVVMNWNPKSQNLKDIAEQLDIGLDSLALFDDSPFEREEVKANAPQVMTFDPQDLLDVVQTPPFVPCGVVTPEAMGRAEQYQQQAVRRQSWQQRERNGDSYEQFLQDSKLQLVIRRPEPAELSRVLEVIQRTNQLNATQQRSTASRLHGSYGDRERHGLWSVWLTDRFGDYGMIGVCLVDKSPAQWEIVELAVSCRAMGRGVEHALLCHVMHEARRARALRLVIRAALAESNQQMIAALRELDFEEDADRAADAGEVLMQRPLSNGTPATSDVAGWLEVRS